MTIVYSDTDKSELGKRRIREAKDVVWNEAAFLPAAPHARMAAYLEDSNPSPTQPTAGDWTCCLMLPFTQHVAFTDKDIFLFTYSRRAENWLSVPAQITR